MVRALLALLYAFQVIEFVFTMKRRLGIVEKDADPKPKTPRPIVSGETEMFLAKKWLRNRVVAGEVVDGVRARDADARIASGAASSSSGAGGGPLLIPS